MIEKQQTLLQLAELRAVTRVRRAYVVALVAQRRASLTAEMARLASRSVESVESLYQAEKISKVSLLQARVEAERATMAAGVAATQSTTAQRALAAAVGIGRPVAGSFAFSSKFCPMPRKRLICRGKRSRPANRAIYR